MKAVPGYLGGWEKNTEEAAIQLTAVLKGRKQQRGRARGSACHSVLSLL